MLFGCYVPSDYKGYDVRARSAVWRYDPGAQRLALMVKPDYGTARPHGVNAYVEVKGAIVTVKLYGSEGHPSELWPFTSPRRIGVPPEELRVEADVPPGIYGIWTGPTPMPAFDQIPWKVDTQQGSGTLP